MNGKGFSPPGKQTSEKSSFGKVKNQGRNSYGPGSGEGPQQQGTAHQPEGNVGRPRSNAIFEQPGRARSNAITSAPGSFNQVKNQGRGNVNQTPDRNATSGGKQNLGRNGYESVRAINEKASRNGLTPKQQVGFDLVSGFLGHVMGEMDKADENYKRSQSTTSNSFNRDEEDRRQQNTQAMNRAGNSEENPTPGEFLKRLGSALADPEKFKKEAAQRALDKQNRGGQHQQSQGQEQRQQSAQRGSGEPDVTPKEFMQRLQGALKDPAGFKRRYEAQQRSQEKMGGTEKGQNQQARSQPGQQQAKTGAPQQRPGTTHPGTSQPGQSQGTPNPTQPGKAIQVKQPSTKTGTSKPIKSSPRRSK